jgi:hypothetical protein
LATGSDPALRELPLIGGIDRFADNADALSAAAVHRRLVAAWPGFA